MTPASFFFKGFQEALATRPADKKSDFKYDALADAIDYPEEIIEISKAKAQLSLADLKKHLNTVLELYKGAKLEKILHDASLEFAFEDAGPITEPVDLLQKVVLNRDYGHLQEAFAEMMYKDALSYFDKGDTATARERFDLMIALSDYGLEIQDDIVYYMFDLDEIGLQESA